MGRRSSGAVIKAFRQEVHDSFLPVTRDLVLNGPEFDDAVVQTMTYGRDGVRYRLFLDTAEMTISTSVELETGSGRLVAELDGLVAVSGIASAGDVRHAARTVHDLRTTLRAQAELVRRLDPLLRRPDGSTAESMFRGVGAKEWSG